MPRSPAAILRALLPLLLLGLYVGQLVPAWQAVRKAESGRDYATYHYAVQAAVGGKDPYDKGALGQLSRAEGTRRSVHPYFYPPPFLLGMLWAVPMPMPTGYRVFFWLNQLALLGTLWGLKRWLRLEWIWLLFLAATLTPAINSAKMGQANIPVMFLLTMALWRRSGGWMALAGMAKMAPALFVSLWGVRAWWRPLLLSATGAIVLSIVALPLVDLAQQLRFYTEVMPGFASGSYHGLTVPINLPANHSIPDLFNQLRPGPDNLSMDPLARRMSSAVSLSLLLGLLAFSRRTRDPIGEAAIIGAFTVLMIITPVYAYEHHLTFALIPGAALAAAAAAGRLSRPALALCALAWAFTAWPLWWLRGLQQITPDAVDWLLQESKFLGLLGLAAGCLLVAARSPKISTQPRN